MIEGKSPEQIQELINDAVYAGDVSEVATIARELLDKYQWLSAIKIANEKLIEVLEEKNR